MKKRDKITEMSPFRVPDGYFDEVNRKIISATSGEIHVGNYSGFYFRIRPYLLVAASIAGFIILSYAAAKLISPHRINPQITEVSTDDFNSPYLNDLDVYSLEETAASLTMPEQGPDVSNAELIEYLVLENIEISEIYEQL